ncbi:MAG: hypothetical protein ACM3JP_02425 [Betaproteobacteria bacterium]
MQNSLERIFEGIENSLRTIVAPTITDSYILSQVTSVAEIIGNLSTRVEWRCAHLLEVSRRVRPVLELALASAPERLPGTADLLAQAAPDAATPNAQLIEARDAHLAALREVQRDLDDHPDDAVDTALREFLAWQLDHEATLLRTGMFSAPKTAPNTVPKAVPTT